MKTTAYYLENLTEKPLLVETDDQDLALKTFSTITNKDPLWLLPRIGKGKIVQNTKVKDTYFQKFWDLEKHKLETFEILEVYSPCKTCGK